jgi:alpha-ketoglutarate-dependent taurine dioxygenase
MSAERNKPSAIFSNLVMGWEIVAVQLSSLTVPLYIHQVIPDMKYRWNGNQKEKTIKNIYQSHFVHHKPHTDRPVIELGPPQCEAAITA